VLLDFEVAAHEAVRSQLGVPTLGCTFHFGQCLWRRIQKEGLTEQYRNPDPVNQPDSPFRVWIGLLKSLALLPADLVERAWRQWLSVRPHYADPELAHKIDRFAEYFEVN
jgi:hypothetical protein